MGVEAGEKSMKQLIEILLGGFAGYCVICFVSMKLFKMEPDEFLATFFAVLEKKVTKPW